MAKEMIGKPAPKLVLPNASGETYTFDPATLKQPAVLFFYPQASTFGCTREACSFRDALANNPLYAGKSGPDGVLIIGVSSDKVEKQKIFVDENKLTYPILSDVDGNARKAYGVPKGLLGLTPGRTTYIIDGGVVKDVYDSVLNYNAHEKFVSKYLAKRAGVAPPPDTAAAETSNTKDVPEPEPAPATEAHTDLEPPTQDAEVKAESAPENNLKTEAKTGTEESSKPESDAPAAIVAPAGGVEAAGIAELTPDQANP